MQIIDYLITKQAEPGSVTLRADSVNQAQLNAYIVKHLLDTNMTHVLDGYLDQESRQYLDALVNEYTAQPGSITDRLPDANNIINTALDYLKADKNLEFVEYWEEHKSGIEALYAEAVALSRIDHATEALNALITSGYPNYSYRQKYISSSQLEELAKEHSTAGAYRSVFLHALSSKSPNDNLHMFKKLVGYTPVLSKLSDLSEIAMTCGSLENFRRIVTNLLELVNIPANKSSLHNFFYANRDSGVLRKTITEAKAVIKISYTPSLYNHSYTGINKQNAGIAVSSARNKTELARAIDTWGKHTFRVDPTDSVKLFGAYFNYTDDSQDQSFMLMGDLEEACGVYKSRYWVQTVFVARMLHGVLKDDDIVWALTHASNTNIQHGAMMFMNTMNQCVLEELVTIPIKDGKIIYPTITTNKHVLQRSNKSDNAVDLSTVLEENYPLSFALYGAYTQ